MVGGPIALIKDGDNITIDIDKRSMTLEVPEAELESRRRAWKAPPPKYTHGVFAKYAKLVSSASKGAICLADETA
jgi:dihydroxy-acid dehydratase